MPTGAPSLDKVESVPSLTIETMVRAVSAGEGFVVVATDDIAEHLSLIAREGAGAIRRSADLCCIIAGFIVPNIVKVRPFPFQQLFPTVRQRTALSHNKT